MKLQVIYLIVSFLLTCVIGAVVLPLLKKMHISQHVRDDGPDSHLKKEGTPSMGGIIFLLGILVISIFSMIYEPTNKDTLFGLLVVTLAFGLVGFIDDFIKTKKKRSLGLKAWQKMILLLAVSGGFVFYLLKVLSIGTDTYIPIYKQFFELGYYFFVPFAILVLISTTNVVNITDGLDGLATGIVIIMMTFFTILGIALGNSAVTAFSAIVTGSCLGFLVFNLNPAKVFMGDTGSLALGGAVGAVSLVLKMPILLFLVAGVCVIEALSDIIQVTYFKLTNGKRIFKMAPLHHHFELCGWSEKKVVWFFWILSIIFCAIAFIIV